MITEREPLSEALQVKQLACGEMQVARKKQEAITSLRNELLCPAGIKEDVSWEVGEAIARLTLAPVDAKTTPNRPAPTNTLRKTAMPDKPPDPGVGNNLDIPRQPTNTNDNEETLTLTTDMAQNKKTHSQQTGSEEGQERNHKRNTNNTIKGGSPADTPALGIPHTPKDARPRLST